MAGTTSCPLTRTQRLVVGEASRSGSNREIAEHLGLSTGAVGYHLHHARRRLGAVTTADAVETCDRLGWLPDPSPGDDEPLPPTLRLYLKAFTASRYPHDPTPAQDRVMAAALAAHSHSRR